MSIEGAAILVVDDNEYNRDLLARQLESQGYRTAVAENGQKALEMMRQKPFDLVLLDIMMPVMTGYEVLEEMKADDDLRHVPVIVITAVDEMDSIVRCIELGAEDHLPKPFPQALLKARIGAALEKKRLRDQERIYLETIKAAQAAKSRFVTAVAHELKNAVTPVRGYVELLRRESFGAINEAQASALEIVATNAERTRALVADLSDVSRIEAGHMQLDLKPVSLEQVVLDVVSAMKAETEAKDLAVSVLVPADLPPVRADGVRLTQVLTNLVNNAVKYTPEGGAMGIWAERTANRWNGTEEAEVVHVVVEDTGIGIADEEQGQIFQEFFRSTDGRVAKTPGVGLGLSISKNLVEMQGGCIWFESEQGKGTTFHFTLPVAEAG